MEKEIIDVLDKISSVLMNLNKRLSEIDHSSDEEYVNYMIGEIQKTIVSLEKDTK